MARLSIFIVFLILAIFALPRQAFAVGEDVFVVPRVAVQAEANSATAAKNSALRAGRRRAMDLLLRRLTVEDDWDRLPRSEYHAERVITNAATADAIVDAGFIRLSDKQLEELESSFEVFNEKSSQAMYRAFVTYRFKPEEVRQLLKIAGVPYSEAQTRTALVVPVLQTANGQYLWESNNPWMAAWKVRPYNNELTPMVAPLGDLEDAAAVSAGKAMRLDEDAFAALAARYGVSQIIVAHAYLRQKDNVDQLRVRLVNAYRTNAGLVATDEPLYSDLTGVGGEPTPAPIATQKVGDILAENWYRQDTGNFPALAERAIEAIIAQYAKPWKEKTLVDHTITNLLNVSAFYTSLNEWAQIREALVATPLIGSVQIRAMSRGGAEMVIQAFGDPSKLIVAMEEQDLVLWNSGETTWQIATPSTQRVIESQLQFQQRRGDGRRLGDNTGYAAPYSRAEPSY